MQTTPRTLNSLEKAVALFALLAVLVLAVGFAQAAPVGAEGASVRGASASAAKKRVVKKAAPRRVAMPRPAHPGLASTGDAALPGLQSSVAYVMDAATGEVILGKNSDAILPIASITKLMTAIVVLDRELDLEQRIVVSDEDMDTLKGTRSRLQPGTALTRTDLLLIALMSSENRAAAALARTYPGGTAEFVKAMNAKSANLGMTDSRFVDATGLSSGNVSSARDLAKLVSAAHVYPLIREYSTRDSAIVQGLGRELAYRNTNGLVRSVDWHIGLSKTGFISEAGRCLVMRVRVASKDLIVVLLDSWGKYSRIGDANRIRHWVEMSVAARQRG